ncbi:MAG: glycosyltransferase family 39 protein [Hormoscilla sp. GM7CHS1pb]|nr:glycosyltransferase family 39 protein [Hormoscilla sp. GM7CHS1pb]UDF05932.1 ORF4 [Hormoscilla sp. GUM007]
MKNFILDSDSNQGRVYSNLGLVICILAILSLHLIKINQDPQGIYIDEASIGLNAATIAETGYDEHGKFLPLFFKAFGEYKNPIYIYLSALIFKLAGVSVFNLRLTSFIFFALALIAILQLIRQVFRKNIIIQFYIVIAFGSLPWFFNLSRIGFEVISQLTIIVLALVFIQRTFNETNYPRWWLINPAFSGFFLGLSIYSYSTSRLLSLLMIDSLIAIYIAKNFSRKSKVISTGSILLGSYSLTILPYLLFLLNNPGALANRFRQISYLFNESLSLFDKVGKFLINYISYLTPHFLLFKGDPNLRHHTGYGGEITIGVFVFFMIGLLFILFKRKILSDSFVAFICINLFLSPLAAALTTDKFHSLRSLLLGLFIFVISCYGVEILIQKNNYYIKTTSKKTITIILTILISFILLFQSILYLQDYFIVYPKKSINYFQSYGFDDVLETVAENHPNYLVILGYQVYVLYEFYQKIHNYPQLDHVNVSYEEEFVRKNRCVIYLPQNGYQEFLDKFTGIYSVIWEVDNPDYFAKLRCYR